MDKKHCLFCSDFWACSEPGDDVREECLRNDYSLFTDDEVTRDDKQEQQRRLTELEELNSIPF
jgi:hypothetical protein